ncbi:vWA domain-containing protein, partial [Ruminococcus sp.]|uniref:vWA domain-containing protein n=1 Tax=Ruminococcus sp. TaxID=41978 RepID=UPI002E81CEE8
QNSNSGNQSQSNPSQNGGNDKQNGNDQNTNSNGNNNSGEEENSNSNNNNSSNNTKLSSEEEKELEEQIKKAIDKSIAQKTVQPQGYNNPQQTSTDANPNAMENIMEKIVLDDSISEAKKVAGKGKVTFDKKYVGGEYDREEERLKKILYDKAKSELVNSKEKEFTNSLKKLARDTHLKGIHQGVNIVIHRQTNDRLPSKEDYKDYLQMYDIPKIVKSARKDLDKVLKTEAFEDELQKQYAGNKFSIKNAYRPDKRVFAKTHQPMEQKDLSVSIMIDNSGSMHGERINSAKKTAVMLYEFCKAENISITIMGHTESGYKDVELYSFADAESFDDKDGQRLLTMRHLSCNRDGAAIRFACDRLCKRPEEKKLFIIISDGQPNGDGYHGEAAYKDLNSIKREYERKGIEFIAAAIGDDKDRIKMIYGRNYLDVDNLEKLPKQLSKIISRKVLE